MDAHVAPATAIVEPVAQDEETGAHGKTLSTETTDKKQLTGDF